MKRQIFTTDAPPPVFGAYSQGIVIDETRMYCAGQGPLNVKTGAKPQGIAAQTAQVIENLKAILEAGGFALSDAVKATVHLADLGDFAEFNRVYLQYFTGLLPVRTTVQSVLADILVEIDLIAEK